MDIHTLIVIIIIILLMLCFFLLNIFQYKKTTHERLPPFTFLLFLTIYILALPIVISTLLIFKLYRSLVNSILVIKYGSQFRGLLVSADAMFAAQGENQVISALMICEFDEKRYLQSPYEVLRQRFYNAFFGEPERFPKFLSSFHKFMGYFFMLKNEVTLDDCVKQMKVLERCDGKLNKKDVMELVTDCSNAPLPKHGTVLWEILIGTQAINWNSNNKETKSYPILFRVHHGVADGVSLLKLLVGTFADNPEHEIIVPEELVHQESPRNTIGVNCWKAGQSVKRKMLDFCEHLQKMLANFLLTAFVLCLAPTTHYLKKFTKGKDSNFLYGPLLSGQSVLALKTEVSQKYVKKIKIIKSKVPGTAFSDVVLTAFSASLDEYFVKNSSSCPRYITVALPVLSGSSELRQLTPGNYSQKLENKFSILHLNFPLHIIDEDDQDSKVSKPVLKRLNMLKAETSALKNSLDYVVNHWILSVFFGLLPHVVLKSFLLFSNRFTIAASVLPGPPKVTVCKGSLLQDLAFWVPYMDPSGVTFSALTYDGRLQIGLNVDKALISNEKAAESILNGVYKFIDILEDEITSQAGVNQSCEVTKL